MVILTLTNGVTSTEYRFYPRNSTGYVITPNAWNSVDQTTLRLSVNADLLTFNQLTTGSLAEYDIEAFAI